jgi:CubicO group peptidase (beta-lactamase class C family)
MVPRLYSAHSIQSTPGDHRFFTGRVAINVVSPVSSVLLALALGPGAATAQTGGTPASATSLLSREIGEYLLGIGRFGFSGAVLVARGDTVVARYASGWADRHRRIRNNVETAFSLGSLSKQFTAAAILRLVMLGRLHLSDSLGRFFPNAPGDKAGITLLQLLDHQGGVSSSQDGRACLTRERGLNAVFRTALRFPPGSDYEYSNAGYNVLAEVVEEAAGEPFERFVRRELWAHAGMGRTGFISDSGRWAPASVATGYDITVATSPYAPVCQWNRKGAGAVISTVTDLFRWSLALDHGVVLDSARREEFFRSRVATHEDPPMTYGLGWAHARTGAGVAVRFHRGDLLPDGFNSGFFRYDDAAGTTVIILSNATDDAWGGHSYPVQDGLEAILFGGSYNRPPPTPSPATQPHADRWLGTYLLRTGGRFDVVREPEGMAITAQGEDAVSALVRPTSRWDSTKASKYDEQSSRLLVLAASRDTAAIVALLGDTAQARGALRIWNALAGARGRARAARPLGSVPTRTPDGPASYVRVVFAADSLVYRVWWDWEGKFLTIHDGVDTPVRRLLWFVDAADARAFDMFNGQAIRLRFERGASVPADELVVETPDGPLRAVRTPDSGGAPGRDARHPVR